MMKIVRVVIALLVLLAPSVAATAPVAPSWRGAGLNIAHWFRYPANPSPAAMDAYLSNADLRWIRQRYQFIRVPIDPRLLTTASAINAVVDAARRATAAGLNIILVPIGSPDAALHLWQILAPSLRTIPASMLMPETVNEPVFSANAQSWNRLQARIVACIRAALPRVTVLITGPDWSSIDGLASLTPPPDPHLALDVHDYEPALLTALGAFDPPLDHQALASLPFPVTDKAACLAAASHTADRPTKAVMAYYCALHPDAALLQTRAGIAAHWAALHHMKLFIGEFGVSGKLNSTARRNWLAAMAILCRQTRAACALWALDDPMGLNLHPPLL
jgi:endoglucanase